MTIQSPSDHTTCVRCMKYPPLKSWCSPRKWLGLALIELKHPHTMKNCFVISFEPAKSLASKSSSLAKAICHKNNKRGQKQKKCRRPGSSKARETLAKQIIHAYRPILPCFPKVQQLFGFGSGDRGSVAQTVGERPLNIRFGGHNNIAKRRVRRYPPPDIHEKQLLKL